MADFRYKAFRTYQRLPETLKRPVGRIVRALPERLLYGSEHVRWYKFVSETLHWDADTLRDYQLKCFKEIVSHAYENIPFYRRSMDEHGIHPSDVNSLEAIRRFPIIDRATAKTNRDEMVATNIPEKERVPVSTSGSSATPLRYFWTPHTHAIERAFVRKIWESAGFHYGEPLIQFRGARQVDRLITYDAVQNWMVCKPVVLDDDFFAKVADLAERFKPKAIMGYPSMLYALACSIEKQNLVRKFASLKVCFGVSEKMFKLQRAKVTEVLGVPVSEWYAMGEQVALFAWCLKCECFHEFPQHSFVEILDVEGNKVTEEGVLGHVIGTSFGNKIFPFIRYRTDDMVTISTEPAKCGWPGRSIKEVHGRCGDFIVAPSGKVLSPTTAEWAIGRLLHVRDSQIYQEQRDELLIRIVPDNNYDKNEGESFAKAIIELLGESMKYKVELVDEIERPASQKKRLIVSKLGQEALARVG